MSIQFRISCNYVKVVDIHVRNNNVLSSVIYLRLMQMFVFLHVATSSSYDKNKDISRTKRPIREVRIQFASSPSQRNLIIKLSQHRRLSLGFPEDIETNICIKRRGNFMFHVNIFYILICWARKRALHFVSRCDVRCRPPKLPPAPHRRLKLFKACCLPTKR